MSDMSADSPRPTVALVVEKVDKVQAITELGFVNVQRQLDQLVGLPERVARLEERVNDLEDDEVWRHGPRLAAIMVIVGVFLAAALTYLVAHI